MQTIPAPAPVPAVRTRRSTRPRRGFTIAEVLLSLTIALVVISSATAFSVQSWRTRRGWTVRETVDRDGRFIGLSLARDVQEAGIAVTSTPVFASIDGYGDTLTVLTVPYEPDEAPVYPIFDDGDTLPTYPPGGTCGATCIEFQKVNGAVTLQAGDIVRLQVASTRRLLLLTDVSVGGGNTFRIEFLPVSRLINRPSGLDSLLLTRSGSTIQQVNVIAYWRDASTKTIKRADAVNSSGQLVGTTMASGVEAFSTMLQFTNGSQYQSYNGADADTLNDGNDILGVKIRAQIKSSRADPSVNRGQPVARWYEWRVAPRNLLYEKNRL